MKFTTLCYIEKDNQYLMMYRNKKKNDLNEGKWVGVGGKFEEKESPEECLLREVKEETGLTLTEYKLRCLVTFVSDKWETEHMYVYTSTKYEGKLQECKEGELKWIDKDKIYDLPIWEGDKLFLKRMQSNEQFFTLKVEYKGDKLVKGE